MGADYAIRFASLMPLKRWVNNMVKSILFVGVGGQGIILASKILTQGLIKFGYDVKMSEVHGMAQRGGSVTTQVRYGEKVYSPLIGDGEADVIVAFEKIEAVRYLKYLKEGGSLVVNDYEIYSLPILIGAEQYPENIIEKLQESVPKTKALKAAEIAEGLGNIKAQNVVMLGSLIKALGLENMDWDSVIKENVPEKFYSLNVKALKAGIGTWDI
jgi:indolepyruvate ferredoxin oxidoreductase beta subunit